MNIDKIKSEIKTLVGERIHLIVDMGRNKEDFFDGIVLSVYPRVFTVMVEGNIKSFSYSDILSKDVIIKKM